MPREAAEAAARRGCLVTDASDPKRTYPPSALVRGLNQISVALRAATPSTHSPSFLPTEFATPSVSLSFSRH